MLDISEAMRGKGCNRWRSVACLLQFAEYDTFVRIVEARSVRVGEQHTTYSA